MKKNIFFAAVAAAFAFACTTEVNDTMVPEPSVPAGMREVTITATAEGATKTTYTDNGEGVGVFSWTKGDQISVMGEDNNFYTFTADNGGTSSTFTGYMPEAVELGEYAVFPASDGHYTDKDENENLRVYFYIDMEKDLSTHFSADLPMTAKKGENNSFSFQHATSALLFTFTNIPNGVVKVKISFENESMQFSGKHQSYYGTPWSLKFLEEGNSDNDRKFIRTVSVDNNTAKVYLPFKGTLWGGYDNTINIVGYDALGNEFELLKDKLMPGNDLQVKTIGEVIPVAPLKLPVNLKNLNWSQGTSAIVDADASYSRIKEMNILSDSDNLYIRMIASLAEPFEGNYLDIFFCDGNGDTALWSEYWTTTCTNKYYYERKGEIDTTTGTITKMRFYTLPDGGGRVYVDTLTEVSDGEVYWYFTYPLTYLEQYKSEGSKIYISAMLWKNWDAYGVIPTKDSDMLEVTLP